MLRLFILSLLAVTAHSRPGHLPTVLSPFSISPSVEILKTPVTKVAVAATPIVQKIESYSAGDSSSAEIRDLLRSLLSELRGGKTFTTLSTPVATYSAPVVLDSYSAPPRNTVTDYSAPVYPDSIAVKKHHHKPEKVVQIAPVVSYVEQAPVAVKEVVKTVYQPVYVPVQYQPQAEYVTVAQPVTQSVAVPTTVKTGASAVAISTIHGSPALAIQQQQVALPVVQQVQAYQPLAAYAAASASAGTAIVDATGSYKK